MSLEKLLRDKHVNGEAIEKMIDPDEKNYLECTTQWLEENSIDPVDVKKYVPAYIFEKIKLELIEKEKMRPSWRASFRTTTLDGFFI